MVDANGNFIPDFGVIEICLVFIYLFIIFLISSYIKNKNIDQYPFYKFLRPALFVKILGGIIFTLFYTYYYGISDTHYYYLGTRGLTHLFLSNPSALFSIIFNGRGPETYSFFSDSTDFLYWLPMYNKSTSFTVQALTIPFAILGFNKFLLTVILLNCFCFIGHWKFFLMCQSLYPKISKQLIISIFFIPSIIFWGSGIMKDTYTLTSTLWFTYNFYMIFIKKKNIIANILMIFFNIFCLIEIKPYIFIVLLPGAFIWIFYNYCNNIENKIIRFLFTPFISLIGLIISIILLSYFNKNLGDYFSMDQIITKAQVTQQDLIREEAYGKHYYNIGTFDNSIGSLIRKAPISIISGLFRPFIWEVKNVVMLFSGLETLTLFLVSLFIIIKVGLFKTIKFIRHEPLLLFSFLFVLCFSFSVGLSSANFGALVRYRIPQLPFFVLGLFILLEKVKELKNENNS